MLIKKDYVVLFQGDSVTDFGRGYGDDNNLGTGYAYITSALFNSLNPELNVKFINRGVSGNRVSDMKERWQKDCIDLKPNVVSILIGINDCWRRFDSNNPMSAEEFKQNYHHILTEVKTKLNCKVIICEPFLLPVTDEQKRFWREDLDPKIQVARELSREFNAVFVPYDGLFAAASTRQLPSYWAADGVHPTPAGHALMSNAWLKAVGAL